MKNVVPVIENDNQLNRKKTLDLKAITKKARIWNCKKNSLFIKNLSPKHAILQLMDQKRRNECLKNKQQQQQKK